MSISRILLGVFSAALLLPGIAHAWQAPDACQSPQLRGRIVEYVIDGRQAAFEIALHPDVMTLLRLPPQIRRANSPTATDLMITTTPMGVTVQPTKASSGTFTVYSDISGHELAVTFSIRVVDDPAQAVSIAVIRQRTASEPAHSSMRVVAQMQCNQYGPALSQIIPGAFNAADMRTVDETVSKWLSERREHHYIRDRMPEGRDVNFEIIEYFRIGQRLYLLVNVVNRERQSYHLDEMQVFDETRSSNHASMIWVASTQGNELPTVIPAGKSMLTVVTVPDGDRLGNPIALMLNGPNHTGVVWRDGIQLEDIQASPSAGDNVRLYTRPDGTRVWDFSTQDENEEKDKAAAGKITLDVQALYGAIWLGDGTGLDELAAASLSGLGVRVGYGINRLLTFEGAVVGATSGAACFTTPDGELERSAMLGRIYMGGLLRFGERFMPTARLGVGLQGASQQSTMVDGSMDDSAFELGILLGAGVGLEARLGESILLGLGISVEGNLITDTPSFESGIHLGYAWKP